MNSGEGLQLAAYLFGLVFGLGSALFISLLWLIFGISGIEFLQERLIDPLTRDAVSSTKFPLDATQALNDSRAKMIVVSDLHADQWHDATNFVRFVEVITKNQSIERLVINGDIADYPGDMSAQTGSGLPRILSLSESQISPANASTPLHIIHRTLRHLNLHQEHPILTTYILGNHDIGLYGLKGDQRKGAFNGAFESIWQPSVMSGSEAGRSTYFEHGQRFDPLLIIYMRYVILDMLRSSNSGRDVIILDALARASSANISSSDTVRSLKRKEHNWYTKILLYRYRASARYCLSQYGSKHVSFGHTHLPDRYVFSNGRTYVNSGDWSVKSGHQTFCIIDTTDNLHGPFQFS